MVSYEQLEQGDVGLDELQVVQLDEFGTQRAVRIFLYSCGLRTGPPGLHPRDLQARNPSRGARWRVTAMIRRRAPRLVRDAEAGEATMRARYMVAAKFA